MAVVCVRGPLRKLAGGRGEHELEGTTVLELLRALERRHPNTGGWIVDERGLIRRHINVFVNGERGGRDDRGRGRRPRRGDTGDYRRLSVTELVVGTKKGLFLLEGEPGGGFDVIARAFAGEPVDFAMRDPRSGRLFATVTSPFYGPKIFYTDGDPDARVGAGRRRRAARGRRPGARADLGHHARARRDGAAVCGRRSRRPVREPRRRRELGAQRRAVGAAVAAALAAGRWRAVPALDLHVAGGAGQARRRGLGGGDVADRRRRSQLAAGIAGLNPGYLPEEALQDENAGRCVHHVERAPTQPGADVHAVPRRRVPLR